ncbi:hypothetical protein V2W45_1326459 [Cenococcum geophilum]
MAENTHTNFQLDAELSCLANGADIPNITHLSNRESHQMLWDSIFGDYKCLNNIVQDLAANPILVGTRLDSKPAYMVLISGDISGDVSDLVGLAWRGSEAKSTPSTKKTICRQDRHGAPV